MVTDEQLLRVCKFMLTTMIDLHAQNVALWKILQDRGIVQKGPEVRAALAWAAEQYRPIREQVQSRTLETIPDILESFQGPIQ